MKTTYADLRVKFSGRSLTAFGPVTDRKLNKIRTQLGTSLQAVEITSDEGELRFNDDLSDPIEPNSPAYATAAHAATVLGFGHEIVAIIGDRE